MMKTEFLRGSMAAFIGALCAGGAIRQSQDGGTAPVIGRTYAESREGVPPAPQDVQRLPNIVWILLDDAGFGASKEGGPNDSLVSELGGGAKPASAR